MNRPWVGTLIAMTVVGFAAARAAPPSQAADEEGEAPAWAREALPDWLSPFIGKRGLPEPWPQRPGPLGEAVAGLDRWQANHFVVYRPETARFLDEKYTPTKVAYRPETLPALEKVVAQYTKASQSAREKAVALLTKAMARHLRHCTIPPVGKHVAADRALDDEDLWASGSAWCNEQARVFVRLCQIAGVPARMIFLFYADNTTGHVVAEFFADGHWAMADCSWLCVFPDEQGRLLSAAELHTSAGRQLADRVYRARCGEVLKLTDAQLALADGAKVRQEYAAWTPPGLGCFSVINYPLPTAAVGDLSTLTGRTATEGDVLAAVGPSVLLASGELAAGQQFAADVQLAAQGSPVQIRLLPARPEDPRSPAAGQITITRDKEGRSLSVALQRPEPGSGKWASAGSLAYAYWPSPGPQKAAKPGAKDAGQEAEAKLLAEGIQPRTWHGRWIPLRIDVVEGAAQAWLDSRFAGTLELPADGRGPIVLQLAKDDRVRSPRIAPLNETLFVPVDLTPYANDRFAAPLGSAAAERGGVRFDLIRGSRDQVNLRPAKWVDWQTDPASYYEPYDGGSPIVFDPRMPMLRVPTANYIAAHVLAVADDDPELTSTLTLRAGSYGGGRSLVARCDFAASVPRRGEVARRQAEAVETLLGPLAHVVVPMSRAIAQDLGPALDIELTKEVRLAVRSPDPCRWRLRPLGPSSGVRIAAMTLEKAPLQMRVGSREAGHAFVEPQRPTFQVGLRNITAALQPYTLAAQAVHLDGASIETRATGQVAAHGTAEVALALLAAKRGYYDLRVTLIDGANRKLQRITSFALLPPDTRRHREQSPFGTWDFCGAHCTPSKAEEVGPLYVKAGLRYGMFGFPPEDLKKYGVRRGTEPNIAALFPNRPNGAQVYRRALERFPDSLPSALIFHETSISGDHNTRVPDLFHDRPPYRLNEKEQQRFEQMQEAAAAAAHEMRRDFPDVKLSFGNGTLPVKEEFYRQKFPSELFDSAGNEAGAFMRPPEAQPPDTVAHGASLWMDRQLLDAYGYAGKPVTQCLEICYPNTNPGNLSPTAQADYLVRHAMHSLAWGVPVIRFGIICDVGNSYYYSNWGASGLCHHAPELNVKPAFVAVATMTRVLDGAKFARVIDMGSPSVYGLEFGLPDGRYALVLWTVRGRRPVRLTCSAVAGEFRLVDDQSNETLLSAKDGTVEVTLRPAPVYLITPAAVVSVERGTPSYEDRPAGKVTVLSGLGSLNDWIQEKTRNVQLEYYNFMTPRRLGDFAFEPVGSFEGRENVLRVTPRPIQHGKDTMPMYGVLAHKQGLPVPGKPTEIGVWVNGNSSWGRMIFELQDASGQRWISIGAAQRGSSGVWFDETIAAELRPQKKDRPVDDWNTNDAFGFSRFDFDGWRYLGFPLPGNYPGEGYHWPYSSQWFHDGDGVVHYPLVFKKLVVELPSKTLHVKQFAPAPRSEIYLKDLTVGQGESSVQSSFSEF